MDPLTALRDYTIEKKLEKIRRVDNEYRFDNEYSFPATMETAYRSKHIQNHQRYTLETLFHFVTNHHLKHTEYMQQARAFRIPAVTLPDRKPLLDYLTGRTATSDSLDPLPPPDIWPLIHPNSVTDDITLTKDDCRTAGPSDHDVTNPIELIKEMERPLRDRDTVLQCRNRDFYTVLTNAIKRDEERHKAESMQRKDNLVAKSRLERGGEEGFDKPKMHLKGSKIGEGVPIILVPSASTTLITIYNVKEFLEDGVFIPTDLKVKQMRGVKPDCVTVQKKFSRDRVVTAYEVRDKPSSLKADDWDRVVAVFVLGKDWQFKDWPFNDHVEIFNKILGFYLRFEDDSVESARVVKQWNVKIISISKNKRHQDRAAALEVWDRLEEFMRSRSH